MKHQPFCRGKATAPQGHMVDLAPEDCPCQRHWMCGEHKKIGPHPNGRRFPTIHGKVAHCSASGAFPVKPCICPCVKCSPPKEVAVA